MSPDSRTRDEYDGVHARISVDVFVGVTVALGVRLVAIPLLTAHHTWEDWAFRGLLALAAIVCGILAFCVTELGLTAIRTLRERRDRSGKSIPRLLAGGIRRRLPRNRAKRLAFIALAGLLLLQQVTEVAAVPSLLIGPLVSGVVGATGFCAYLLAHRRWRRPQDNIPAAVIMDTGMVLVVTTAILLLIDRNSPAVQGAAALLLPVEVAGSIGWWRATARSRSSAVGAAADLVASMLLGISVVISLVWFADLLDMPPAEVTLLKVAFNRFSAIAELRWWVKALVFAALAAVLLSFARWPDKLARESRWFNRLHMVPLVKATSRILSGLHFGLLTIALIGLVAPVAAGPVLRARLEARYTETAAAELRSRAELAAYRQVTDEFRGQPGRSGSAQVTSMTSTFKEIFTASPPVNGETPTESDLALAERAGASEGTVLAKAAQDAEPRTARPASGSPEDLGQLAQATADVATAEDAATEQVEQAAELAASAISNAVSGLPVGDNVIVEVAKEYLSGLIERSPLSNALADWAGKIAGTAPSDGPADAAPPPDDLQGAVAAALASEPGLSAITRDEILHKFADYDPGQIPESVLGPIERSVSSRLCPDCADGDGDEPGETDPDDPPDLVPGG